MEAYYLRQSKGYYPLVIPSIEAFNKKMSSSGNYSLLLPTIEPLNKLNSSNVMRTMGKGGTKIVKHNKHHRYLTTKTRNKSVSEKMNNELIKKPSNDQDKVLQKPKKKLQKKKKW